MREDIIFYRHLHNRTSERSTSLESFKNGDIIYRSEHLAKQQKNFPTMSRWKSHSLYYLTLCLIKHRRDFRG